MKCSLRFGNRGTTLIESVVALALFGITMAGIGKLMTQHLRRAGTNNTYTSAIALAEQELEDLRSKDYNSILSRTTTTAVGATTFTVGTVVVADSPAANMKSITTNVTWQEPAGSQTYTIYAIYTAITG